MGRQAPSRIGVIRQAHTVLAELVDPAEELYGHERGCTPIIALFLLPQGPR